MKGSPQQIGVEYGKRFADNIRAENETLDLKINPGNLERIKKYTRILQRHCPWWLEEAAARARGSDIPEELILLANCMKVWPEKVEFENNCTAFLAMGDQTPDGSIYLLKNRDYRICEQVAGTMEMDGTYRYIYGSNIDSRRSRLGHYERLPCAEAAGRASCRL